MLDQISFVNVMQGIVCAYVQSQHALQSNCPPIFTSTNVYLYHSKTQSQFVTFSITLVLHSLIYSPNTHK